MSFIPSYKKPSSGGGGYVPCEWSSGTDAEIIEALEQHYAGNCDLHDYWSVGDERTISLPYISTWDIQQYNNNAQDVTFVLTEVGGKTLSDGTTECVFQVDMKDCFNANYRMNSTATNAVSGGSWNGSGGRKWLNNYFYESIIPSSIKPIFKQFKNYTAQGGGSRTIVEALDYFALRAEIEIFGSSAASVTGEGTYIEYYKTSSNRIKYNSSGEKQYILRSPNMNNNTTYMGVNTSGTITAITGNTYSGFSPFGCI